MGCWLGHLTVPAAALGYLAYRVASGVPLTGGIAPILTAVGIKGVFFAALVLLAVQALAVIARSAAHLRGGARSR